MENSEIISLTYELKDKIVNNDFYKILKDKERKMLEDETCSKLLLLFQNKQNEYNEAKRFEKYGSDVERVSRELSEIKYKLYENKFVKEYNEAYKKMYKELKCIEKIIFKDFVKERKEIEI